MDASTVNLEGLTEAELRDLLRSAQEALDRLVAKRARSTLREARRMAAEVGFEATFTKTAKPAGGKAEPQAPRKKATARYRNPDNPAETWAGRGRAPRWVQAALAEGQTLDDLAIPAEAAAA